jgi:hypothetical protein
MKNYKTIISPMGDEIIQYEENGVLYTIPKDPANSDYQRYLNPEAEQSTPSVIDEATTI